MSAEVIEFIGVYDADSTIVGEVSYWIGARLGRRHCSLCELTHGVFTVKSEWTSCSQTLDVPFLAFHRNDAPADVLAAAEGSFPIVFARTSEGLTCVLDRKGLEKFDGSTVDFVEWLRAVHAEGPGVNPGPSTASGH